MTFEFFIAIPPDDQQQTRLEELFSLGAFNIASAKHLHHRLRVTLTHTRPPSLTGPTYDLLLSLPDVASATAFKLAWSDYAVQIISEEEAAQL